MAATVGRIGQHQVDAGKPAKSAGLRVAADLSSSRLTFVRSSLGPRAFAASRASLDDVRLTKSNEESQAVARKIFCGKYVNHQIPVGV
jgi:hypothetical protein